MVYEIVYKLLTDFKSVIERFSILRSIIRVSQPVSKTCSFVLQGFQMVPYYNKNTLRYYVARARYFCFAIIINLIIFCFFTINTQHSLTMHQGDEPSSQTNKLTIKKTFDYVSATNGLTKYMLLWTSAKCSPFVYFGQRNDVFVNKTCKFQNCYVTTDRNFLGKYTEFDVIAFNGPQLSLMLYTDDVPKERNSHQKYVYANIESAQNYPVHTKIFDGFFNWTWTYKLSSDAVWSYFVVKDANNNVVGPHENMQWISVDNMEPIDEQLANSLRSKKQAAVWFSSNCLTASRREDYIRSLQRHLKSYNMDIDIYGECGPSQCPKQLMQHCLNMIRRDYFFYLAFENSFSDDYVTEKFVYALKYDTVPVVYGGANYSRLDFTFTSIR